MKRIFILLGILTVFLIGCEVRPYADFIVDYRFVQPNEMVRFTNLSDRATSYHWDFGDGTITSIPSPTHVYTSEGIYTVTLTAFSRDGNRDVATMTIEVYYTELEVTVAKWNSREVIEYIVPDASVRLYPTLADWDFETNMVVEGYTNSNGVVTFIGLRAQRYYVDVWHDFYDNYALRDWDPSYITTHQLVPYQFNTFLAWADYYPPAYKRGRENKTVSAKINQQRRTLLEIDVSN
ncbi:hypothetical protein ES705_11410 [subsurface metagenome]